LESLYRAHMAVLVANDFFTVEVLTLTGLITYYVAFFIHLESRRICLAGITRYPDQETWFSRAWSVPSLKSLVSPRESTISPTRCENAATVDI
jgi:hypothetical protein